MASSKAPAVGIDLGSTNTCVAVWWNGRVEVIANDIGKRTTPSCVAFSDIERYVGKTAMVQRSKNPENTVHDVKRLMGRRFDEATVQEDLKCWPFKVIDVKSKPRIQVKYMNDTKTYASEEISAMILEKMKEAADKFLDCDVKDAVITVPAYFNNSQRQATLDAGKIAGLNVLQIINEPTAAALAYGIDVTSDQKRKVLIYDFGGGTFDVSIVSIEKGPRVEVLATSGDTRLGGTDIDQLLVNHLAEKFKKDTGLDVIGNRPLSKLKSAAENVKIILSTALKTDINIEALMDGIDLEAKISRPKFEQLCSDLINSTLVYVEDAIKQAELTKQDIDEVVLVGGSTRIPKVKQFLQEFFPGTSIKETINPDEAVAYGAAIQAAILSDDAEIAFKDLKSTDVVSLSIGVDNAKDTLSVIVPRNTRIPCEISRTRFTRRNNQTNMLFKLYEGEKTIAKDNHYLDEFTLFGIPPAPAGKGEALLTFNLNNNGILKVTAIEKITGKSNSIVISMKEKSLSEADVKRMIEEAEKERQQEVHYKKRVEAKTQLEQFTYRVLSVLNDTKTTLDAKIKREALKRFNANILWLEDNEEASKEELETKMEQLQEMCSSMQITL